MLPFNPLFWLAAKFIETDIYRRFARSWLANFTFRVWGWPEFKCSNYFEIREAMLSLKDQQGLFVYMATDTKGLSFSLNHLFTGCSWAHAGFLFIDGKQIKAKSMTSNGLSEMHLLDYLSRVDNFCVGFLPMTAEGVGIAKERLARIDCAADCGSLGYDFTIRLEQAAVDFVIKCVPLPEQGAVKMYCSEYIYLVCCDLVEGEAFKPSWFYDREVFEPDDVYHASKVIYLNQMVEI